MNKNSRQLLSLVIRYAILIIVAVPNLWIFYFIFLPLTSYSVNFLLDLFFKSASLAGNIITISGCFPVEIVGACVGGSAYYLLLILNLSTPGINILKRIKFIAASFLAFFFLNLLRILILSFLFISGSPFFDITHSLFWYALSTIFVVGIWFAGVKFFRIKNIPFYSDLKFILKKIKK
jgi:exosortase/archaeosortase family protein